MVRFKAKEDGSLVWSDESDELYRPMEELTIDFRGDDTVFEWTTEICLQLFRFGGSNSQ